MKKTVSAPKGALFFFPLARLLGAGLLFFVSACARMREAPGEYGKVRGTLQPIPGGFGIEGTVIPSDKALGIPRKIRYRLLGLSEAETMGLPRKASYLIAIADTGGTPPWKVTARIYSD